MKPHPRYHCAAGLSYGGRSDEVPSLQLKGQDWMADEIVRLARRYGVPVVERPGLARSLMALEEERDIPESLFAAVAKLFLELERRFKRR